MTPNEIREHLKAQPFHPLRLHVSDGASYEVRDPTYAYVTISRVELATEFDEYETPKRSIYLDPRHITRIEPINGGRKKR